MISNQQANAFIERCRQTDPCNRWTENELYRAQFLIDSQNSVVRTTTPQISQVKEQVALQGAQLRSSEEKLTRTDNEFKAQATERNDIRKALIEEYNKLIRLYNDMNVKISARDSQSRLKNERLEENIRLLEDNNKQLDIWITELAGFVNAMEEKMAGRSSFNGGSTAASVIEEERK